MAGSLKWMIYTADSGQEFLTFVDESNSEPLGFADMTPATPNLPQLPRSFEMRYVNLTRTGLLDEVTRKKAWVGTAARLGELDEDGTVTINGLSWRVSSTRGEKRRRAIPQDTGLTDGDDT